MVIGRDRVEMRVGLKHLSGFSFHRTVTINIYPMVICLTPPLLIASAPFAKTNRHEEVRYKNE